MFVARDTRGDCLGMTERDFKILKKIAVNQLVIKQFRNTSAHQYGVITDSMTYACLMHCIDKDIIDAVNELIENHAGT